MRGLFMAFSLAMKDYVHERLLSACSILGLAAVLAPLMVLLGVHHGIITAMTERLTNDPRTLEVTPVGSGKYGPAWFNELAAMPEVAFVLPQTRSIAATMNLRTVPPTGGGDAGAKAVSPLIASGTGDPLLLRWQEAVPRWEAQGDAPVAGVVLTESLGRKLGIAATGVADAPLLEGRVERVREGKRESAALRLHVLAVLPPEAHGTDALYVPLELLVATEDYRDGKAVPFLGWTGDEPDYAGVAPGEEGLRQYADHIRSSREYASFRLYAVGLEEVAPLWQFFQKRHVEVYVRIAEIETVTSLDHAFTLVFALITGAALFGFCASTASNALAGVRRKSRSLGVMRLLGFTRGGMLIFPMAQTTATGVLGFLLAYALYLGVAHSIDVLFAGSLPGGEAICSLPPLYVGAVFIVVILLTTLSSCSAAWQATAIEPSEVIRDV